MTPPLRLQVVLGSTRPTRAGEQVAEWVIRRAHDHEAFRAELLDLREWELPIFGEHPGSIGDFADPTYSAPVVRAWNRKVAEGDAYLFVTPEYVHSVPGVLKNALDSVFLSFAFRNKPVSAVGYSVGLAAGARAVEHLAQIMVEAEAAPLRNTVLLPHVGEAFDDEGAPRDPMAETALQIVLDDLAWWGAALRAAREEGELLPGSFRMRAAASA